MPVLGSKKKIFASNKKIQDLLKDSKRLLESRVVEDKKAKKNLIRRTRMVRAKEALSASIQHVPRTLVKKHLSFKPSEIKRQSAAFSTPRESGLTPLLDPENLSNSTADTPQQSLF
jgi:hypothetical protein